MVHSVYPNTINAEGTKSMRREHNKRGGFVAPDEGMNPSRSLQAAMGFILASFAYILCCVSIVQNRVTLPPKIPKTGAGSTFHLREIFIGRCWEYQELHNPSLLAPASKDCNTLWDNFFSAFAHKEPCDVTSGDYEEYIDEASQIVPADKTMLWSGIYDLVHQFAESGKRYITLEDTLIGFIANSLVWCGQKMQPGINYVTCPAFQGCPASANTAFWGSASKTFAATSSGKVTLALFGSNPDRPAYRNDSFFAQFELPALRVAEVTSLDVLIVHNLTVSYRETCKNGSLPTLQKAVEDRGLNYSCEDDPKAVIHLMCVDDVESRECQLIKKAMGDKHHYTFPVGPVG